MADELDKNGMKNIYLKRQGGKEWFMGDVIPQYDPQLTSSSQITKVTGDYYVLASYVKSFVDVSIPNYVPAPYNSGHAAAVARGWMTSPNDWGDGIEFSVTINVTRAITSTDSAGFFTTSFYMLGPTGEHPTNRIDCTGSAYGIANHLYANPPVVEITKEMFHELLFFDKEETLSDFDRELNGHGDVGIKLIVFVNYGPDSNYVLVEHWLNESGDKTTWTKVNEFTDTPNQVGSNDETCGGDGTQILNYRNGKMRLYMNWADTDFKFKNLSVREVTRDPNEIPTDPPVVVPPPQAGTYRRIYSVIYDMGEFEGDACLIEPNLGGGPPEPPPITYEIYNVPQKGTEKTPINNGTYRQGIFLQYGASQLIGEKPIEVTWFMEKNGNPSSQPITCHIRRGTDDAIVETFDWESGTLTANLLTVDTLPYTFKNDNADYALQQGDYVTVEYTAGTSSNYVDVAENTDAPFDGSNTCKRKYDSGGPPPTSWGTKSDSRDLAAIIKAKG